MKSRRILTIGLCFAALMFGLDDGSPASEHSNLEAARWIGRVDKSRSTLYWPGAGFEIRFHGSTLEADLADVGNNFVMLEVDGSAASLGLQQGTAKYTLAAGLANADHVVRVFKRTQAFVGSITLSGLSTDGTFLKAAPPSRSILAIGDSILTGYGIEGADRNCNYSPATENQYLTYPALAARRFNADLTVIAASGRGVSENWDGSTTDTLPTLFERLNPMDPNSNAALDPKDAYDVVVVNLGTNDFGNGKRPAEFEASYLAFLSNIRRIYPHARMFAAFGPMLASEDYNFARGAIDRVVARMRSSGDENISPLYFASTMEPDLLGCDWHPNVRSHEMMSLKLIDAIHANLMW